MLTFYSHRLNEFALPLIRCIAIVATALCALVLRLSCGPGCLPMNRGSWVVGLGTVLFDVDVGPKVEHLVPEDALTVEERQDVAFHAFPVSCCKNTYMARAAACTVQLC